MRNFQTLFIFSFLHPYYSRVEKVEQQHDKRPVLIRVEPRDDHA
jgi:hypothetical protein